MHSNTCNLQYKRNREDFWKAMFANTQIIQKLSSLIKSTKTYKFIVKRMTYARYCVLCGITDQSNAELLGIAELGELLTATLIEK